MSFREIEVGGSGHHIGVETLLTRVRLYWHRRSATHHPDQPARRDDRPLWRRERRPLGVDIADIIERSSQNIGSWLLHLAATRSRAERSIAMTWISAG
jgi:hypothetical protein